MLNRITIIDASLEEPTTWSRYIRLTYRNSFITMDLVYGGEWEGYSVIIHDIECYGEDAAENSRIANLIEDELSSLTQSELYELDELSRKAQEVLS